MKRHNIHLWFVAALGFAAGLLVPHLPWLWEILRWTSWLGKAAAVGTLHWLWLMEALR